MGRNEEHQEKNRRMAERLRRQADAITWEAEGRASDLRRRADAYEAMSKESPYGEDE